MGKASPLFGFPWLGNKQGFRSRGNSHQKAAISQGKDLAKPRGITLRGSGHPPASLKTCHAIRPEGNASLKSRENWLILKKRVHL